MIGSSFGMFQQQIFNVLGLPGLLAWYKASDVYGNNTNPPDGTTLAIWNDKSPNAYNFTQGSGAAQPTFLVNQQNGLPGVYFVVPNDMVGPNAFLTNVSSGVYTLYMVMKVFSGDNIPFVAVTDDLSNRFNFIVPLSSTKNVYIDYGDVNTNHRLIVNENDIYTGGTYAHCFQVNTPIISNFRNNILLGTNNAAGTFTAGTKIPHMGDGVSAAMMLFEIILCNQAHNTTTMDQVFSYLKDYWNY